MTDDSGPRMQAEADQGKNFGQPVVSNDPSHLDAASHDEGLLTPAQAAIRPHGKGVPHRRA